MATDRRTWIRRALIAGTAGIGANSSGGMATTTSSWSSSGSSSPARSIAGPGRSPGRCAGSSATTRSGPSWRWPIRPSITSRSASGTWPRELGFRWIHIPIVDQRGTKDRDAEEAISDLLDRGGRRPGRPRELSALLPLPPRPEPHLDGPDRLPDQVLRLDPGPGRRRDRPDRSGWSR